MPRYLLHFFETSKDLARDTPAEVAQAERFTEALIEMLRRVGEYEFCMIIKLTGEEVITFELANLEDIRDELKTWYQDGVFETL